jgi:hypothetical protein
MADTVSAVPRLIAGAPAIWPAGDCVSSHGNWSRVRVTGGSPPAPSPPRARRPTRSWVKSYPAGRAGWGRPARRRLIYCCRTTFRQMSRPDSSPNLIFSLRFPCGRENSGSHSPASRAAARAGATAERWARAPSRAVSHGTGRWCRSAISKLTGKTPEFGPWDTLGIPRTGFLSDRVRLSS